jgi:hypothetical protein
MFTESYYLTIFLFFSIFGFIIAVDRNVSDYIILLFQLMKINIEKYYWMIKLHPKNPVTNYFMRRKYFKIARDLHEELNKKPLD